MTALRMESQDSLVPSGQHLEMQYTCIYHGITNSSSTGIGLLLCVLQRVTFTVDMLVSMLALGNDSQHSLEPLVQHLEK
jgi:hypothetical protein